MAAGLDRPGTVARGRAHRPAGRAQLVVQRSADRDRSRQGRRGGRTGPRPDRPGPGHRSQRRPARRRRDRGDRRPRPARDGARHRQLRRLAAALRARRPDAAGLDLALPAGTLAPRQRPDPDRVAGRRRDACAEGHRRAADPAVLPADGRHRDAAGHPAGRVDRHDRDRHRGDHRRRGERLIARDRGLHLPRRAGRDRDRPTRRPAPGLRPGVGRGVRGERPRRLGLLAYSARATCAGSSSCGSPRRRRPRGPALPRSGRSRSSARCSGS